MLYVAYGSNLNKDQMYYRVPGAKPYGKGVVYNWQLNFHGNDGTAYATIVPAPGRMVPVVLWDLPDKDVSIMDRYEGYPNAYYKKEIPVHVKGKKKVGVVYIMNTTRRVARPSRKYVNTVRAGYEAFGLDLKYLEDALERNSRDFYQDDLIEVREFKRFKNNFVSSNKNIKNKAKKGSKSSNAAGQRFVRVGSSNMPGSLAGYMRKTFPEDSYWNSAYGYEDDYSSDYYSSRKPSLDDYDFRK